MFARRTHFDLGTAKETISTNRLLRANRSATYLVGRWVSKVVVDGVEFAEARFGSTLDFLASLARFEF